MTNRGTRSSRRKPAPGSARALGARSWRALLAALTGSLLLALSAFSPAAAFDRLGAEETIADLLPARFPDSPPNGMQGRRWALLPQLGYGPDTSVLAGAKFVDRDLFDSGTTIDLDGTYALNEQQSLEFSVGSPHLLDNRLLMLLRARYDFDPQREFFGLGDVNVDGPVSTHEFQDLGGELSIGWRPFRRISLNFEVGIRQIDIRNGKRKDDLPFTPVAFPDLPGIDGGVVNPIALSLVWNTRDDIVRPTRGWRLLVKALHTDKSLFSDFEFSRFFVDAGYLRAFNQGHQIIGLRANGEWIEAPISQVPFWELAELGGSDTLRGFFPHRFAGKGRVLLNLEFRFRLLEFDFSDLWHVKLDGVVFGDTGRVYLDSNEVRDEFHLNQDLLDRIIGDFQYSYGPGLRIALSDALVARIDAGFSKEETGLVYLSFGQTF